MISTSGGSGIWPQGYAAAHADRGGRRRTAPAWPRPWPPSSAPRPRDDRARRPQRRRARRLGLGEGEAAAGRRRRPGAAQGVVCCWTGTGASIAVFKVPGIRAALCADAETARGARKWNDANVLAPFAAHQARRCWPRSSTAGSRKARARRGRRRERASPRRDRLTLGRSRGRCHGQHMDRPRDCIVVGGGAAGDSARGAGAGPRPPAHTRGGRWPSEQPRGRGDRRPARSGWSRAGRVLRRRARGACPTRPWSCARARSRTVAAATGTAASWSSWLTAPPRRRAACCSPRGWTNAFPSCRGSPSAGAGRCSIARSARLGGARPAPRRPRTGASPVSSGRSCCASGAATCPAHRWPRRARGAGRGAAAAARVVVDERRVADLRGPEAV